MRRIAPLLLLLVACQTAPQTAPSSAFDPAKLGAIRAKMQEHCDQAHAAGLVTLVGTRDGIVHLEAVGLRDLETKSPMRADTLFQIASMTKPITAIAVLMCEEDGKLSTDDPVEKHLPEFRGQRLVKSRQDDTLTLGKPARPITIKDLLTHTSGLRGGFPPGFGDVYSKRNRTLHEAVIAVSQTPLEFEPGTKWAYCNAGIDVLGRLVEVASGKSFEAFLDERLFRPLGMRDTLFYPVEADRGRIATLYKKDGAGLKKSENALLGDGIGGRFPVPAGGLYSTAPDLAKLYRMLLLRGTVDGRRYLGEASLEKMTKNQAGDLKAGFTDGIVMGFGFQLVGKPTGVTEMLSAGTYGHGGAWGTQGWIDPAAGVFIVLMVQRSGFPNGDASDLRRDLQTLAVSARTSPGAR